MTTPQYINDRIDRCVALGLNYNFPAESYVQDDINIALVDIKVMSDEDFNAMFEKVEREVQRRKDEK